jgi:acyl-CoA synthetase (NDP forming)
VVSIFVPPMRRGQEAEVAARLRDVVAGQNKPLLSTFLGFDGVPAELAAPGEFAPMRGSIPSYSSPERAVAALAHVLRYANWRRRDAGQVPELSGTDPIAARDFVDGVLAAAPDGRRLTMAESQQLLAWYGIRMACGKDAGEPVRPMAPPGVDTILEVHDDRSFGALVSFGIGGLATELLNDRAYAVVPLTSLDAAELIGGPKAFPLLTGYGGAEPADVPALAEMALRLSALADDLPEVVECTLAPMVAAAEGAHVLGATIRVAQPTARSDVGARRLRGL